MESLALRLEEKQCLKVLQKEIMDVLAALDDGSLEESQEEERSDAKRPRRLHDTSAT